MRKRGVRGWNGWTASLMHWTWTWAESRRWLGTGRPGMLQTMGSQRAGHDWMTEQQQWGYYLFLQYKNKNPINHMERRKQHIQVNGSSWIQHPEPVPWKHAILHCIKFLTSSPDTHYIQRKKGSITLNLRRHRNQSLFSFGKWIVWVGWQLLIALFVIVVKYHGQTEAPF